jgi:replicative DNA helicase
VARKLPSDEEAEAAIVGAVLLRNEALDEVADMISAGDFYVPAHAAVFRAMQNLRKRGRPIDTVTLQGQMGDDDTLGLVGGVVGIGKLADRYPSSYNVVHHALRVREVAGLRRFLGDAYELLEGAGEAMESPAEWCESTVDRLTPLARFGRAGGYERAAESILPTIQEGRDRAKLGWVRTPYADLNTIMDGWIEGELTYLAARPSHGKTAVMLDSVRSTCRGGDPALVFSFEMSKQQLMQRILSAESGVDSKRWRDGAWQSGDIHAITEAAKEVHSWPLWVVDAEESREIGSIKSAARQWRRDRDVFPRGGRTLGLVAVDYVQLVHVKGFRFGQREQELSVISRGLQRMAKELRLPVLALAQLNRDVDQRKGHVPMLSDLRESGSLEQDGDAVIFVRRNDKYPDISPRPPKGSADVWVAKSRNGETGHCRLDFVDHLVTFVGHQPPPYAPKGGEAA